MRVLFGVAACALLGYGLATIISAARSDGDLTDSATWAAPRRAVVPAGTPRASFTVSGAALFASPSSPARRQADDWRSSRPANAALMDRLASQPTAIWLGEWSGDVRAAVAGTATAAQTVGQLPVFVAYNIPYRDCGGHSAGGVAADAYRAWIREIAAGLLGGPAVVILEPDALAEVSCLTSAARDERLALLRDAVDVLKAAGAAVYLDAGNARWQPADTMAVRLADAGVADADGFALNVANFVATDVTIAYGEAISGLTGGKHFIVDTSRNGAGGTADAQWCNPPGQSLGADPTTTTGHPLVDAYLWVKVPGESDGACNGGLSAGTWWPEYALGLVQQARADSSARVAQPLRYPAQRRRERVAHALLLETLVGAVRALTSQ